MSISHLRFNWDDPLYLYIYDPGDDSNDRPRLGDSW